MDGNYYNRSQRGAPTNSNYDPSTAPQQMYSNRYSNQYYGQTPQGQSLNSYGYAQAPPQSQHHNNHNMHQLSSQNNPYLTMGDPSQSARGSYTGTSAYSNQSQYPPNAHYRENESYNRSSLGEAPSHGVRYSNPAKEYPSHQGSYYQGAQYNNGLNIADPLRHSNGASLPQGLEVGSANGTFNNNGVNNLSRFTQQHMSSGPYNGYSVNSAHHAQPPSSSMTSFNWQNDNKGVVRAINLGTSSQILLSSSQNDNSSSVTPQSLQNIGHNLGRTTDQQQLHTKGNSIPVSNPSHGPTDSTALNTLAGQIANNSKLISNFMSAVNGKTSSTSNTNHAGPSISAQLNPMTTPTPQSVIDLSKTNDSKTTATSNQISGTPSTSTALQHAKNVKNTETSSSKSHIKWPNLTKQPTTTASNNIKKSPKPIKPNKSPKSTTLSKRIEIPTDFPPRHSFRATAAYSLLRTLSKELRLSPFTLQSFLAALMLPIPSRLLGEIHVRVMRVLFAHSGMGNYSKLGSGEGAVFLKRVRREKVWKHGDKLKGDDAMDKEEEYVRARSYDNLFYLDNLTWPLFLEDYVITAEEKFLQNANTDDEEFIDARSLAIIQDDIHLNARPQKMTGNKSAIPPYPGEGWIDRCPVGPFGRRNPTTGRFVCCPFHIHAVLKKAGQGCTVTTDTAPLPKKRKRSKTPKSKKYTSDGSSSDFSNDSLDSDSDEDFTTQSKKTKGRGKRGRPRKCPKTEKASDVTTTSLNVNHVTQPHGSTLQINTPIARPVKNPPVQCQPILVPPIPPQAVDLNAMVVPKSTEETILKYFLEGDIFQDNIDKASDDMIPSNSMSCSSIFENDCGKMSITDALAKEHKHDNSIAGITCSASMEQLRKGVPYHHLSLEMKLQIMEFLLDELLDVDDISKELALRRQLTGAHNALYGEVPSQHEYENMVNEDECLICGLEGDMLCCDGCPGSFHRQCMGMSQYQKIPDGKWYCPECRVTDASKMAQIQSESRPFIGWFTLNELDASSPLIHQGFHDTSSAAPSLAQTHSIVSYQVTGIPHQSVTKSWNQINPQTGGHLSSMSPRLAPTNTADSIPGRIPAEVEFLITAGKVFARYRESHEKFDPFNPFGTDSKSSDMTTPPVEKPLDSTHNSPPEPLSKAETIQLLKLLGPCMCLKLPWRRLIFNAIKVFTSDNAAEAPNTLLHHLIAHQNEARALLANHPETCNPLDYDNRYRKAPPIPNIKLQLGQFVLPTVLPDMFTVTPKSAAQFGLSLATTLSLNSVAENNKVSLVLSQDVLHSVQDQLIKSGRQLYDSCLVDYRWATLDRWTAQVREAKSYTRLSFLLVKLADACSLRAFQNEWYQVKINGNHDESTRHTLVPNYSALIEGWTVDGELELRRWQRCTKANVLSLLNSNARSKNAIKNLGVATKRGKKVKQADEAAKPNTTDKTRIDENMPLPCDKQLQSRNMVSPDELNTARESGSLKKPTPPPKPSTPPSKVDDSPVSYAASIGTNFTPNMHEPSKSISSLNKSYEKTFKHHDEANPNENSTADSAGAETSPTQKPKHKKKRRTTRSLSPIPSAKRRCSDRFGVLRRQIEALVFGKVEFSNRIDEEIHRLKLEMLDEIVLHTNESSLFFAIAGKKLFEPEGSIQKQAVKRLARNAGSVRAPLIAYETPFEVGESTTCNYWRTMTLNGSTFEDFMLSLKFFSEHLDKSTISSSTTIFNRISKPDAAPVKYNIRCAQIDQMTGMKAFFVVNEDRKQGKWQLECNIDLPPFISYQREKGRPYREEYNKMLIKKQEEYAKKREEEAKKFALRKAEEAKKQAQSKRLADEKKRAEIQRHQTELLNRMAAQSAKSKTSKACAKPSAKAPAVLNSEVFETILSMHTRTTFNLLAGSAARGEASVPVLVMAAARKTTMAHMHATNVRLKNSSGQFFSDDVMKTKMSNAEQAAIKKYVEYQKIAKKK